MTPTDFHAPKHSPSTWLLFFLLLVAVATCSSAAVVFRLLIDRGVPPFLAASWRLWCQEIVVFIPFLLSLQQTRRKQREYDIILSIQEVMLYDDVEEENCGSQQGQQQLSPLNTSPKKIDLCEEHMPITESSGVEHKYFTKEWRDRYGEQYQPLLTRWISSLPLMLVSGFFFGLHFSSWLYSIQRTSLAHSLLWVSMGPIIINWGQWMIFICNSSTAIRGVPVVAKPSNFETVGAAVGLFGAILMLLDIRQDKDGGDGMNVQPSSSSSAITALPRNYEPTFEGDFAAFFGAFAVSMYFIIGRNLRSWMPVWMYAFPVVGAATLTCVLFSMLDPTCPATISGTNVNSVFGFLNHNFFWMTLYLGAGPGVCGHTLMSGLLKYLSPLTVSTAMILDPLIGSVLGYFLGMQSMPGRWTWLGGAVLVFGLLLVVASEQGVEISWKSFQRARILARQNARQSAMPLSSPSLNAIESYGAIQIE